MSNKYAHDFEELRQRLFKRVEQLDDTEIGTSTYDAIVGRCIAEVFSMMSLLSRILAGSDAPAVEARLDGSLSIIEKNWRRNGFHAISKRDVDWLIDELKATRIELDKQLGFLNTSQEAPAPTFGWFHPDAPGDAFSGQDAPGKEEAPAVEQAPENARSSEPSALKEACAIIERLCDYCECTSDIATAAMKDAEAFLEKQKAAPVATGAVVKQVREACIGALVTVYRNNHLTVGQADQMSEEQVNVAQSKISGIEACAAALRNLDLSHLTAEEPSKKVLAEFEAMNWSWNSEKGHICLWIDGGLTAAHPLVSTLCEKIGLAEMNLRVTLSEKETP